MIKSGRGGSLRNCLLRNFIFDCENESVAGQSDPSVRLDWERPASFLRCRALLQRWDTAYTNGRSIMCVLQSCPGAYDIEYRLIAMDHGAAGVGAGHSDGGSVWHIKFQWSDCETNEGKHYQLRQSSIQWFHDIADGADPVASMPDDLKPAAKPAAPRDAAPKVAAPKVEPPPLNPNPSPKRVRTVKPDPTTVR
jgi:hypothetical protein